MTNPTNRKVFYPIGKHRKQDSKGRETRRPDVRAAPGGAQEKDL